MEEETKKTSEFVVDVIISIVAILIVILIIYAAYSSINLGGVGQ